MAQPTRKPRIIPGFSAEQSAALFAMFGPGDDTLFQITDRDATTRIYTSSTTARAGQFLRVSPPDSSGLGLLLPPPTDTRPGDTVTVSLENPLGPLRVSCVPIQGAGARVTQGVVNGLERATFTVAGELRFTSNGATGWTTAAEHPAESAAAPAITPTASTEILPSNPSGSIWTWALRPFSVVLGRLAKQVGLTVIGNATDALAAVSAVTATAARQALLVNSSGTAIGWRAIEAADLPAASPYGWDDVLATDAHSGAHTPIVDSGQALNFASGATGVTADGDLTAACVGAFELTSTDAHIHPTGALHLGHEGTTASIHQGCVGAWEGVCADFSLQSSSTVSCSAGTSITLSTAAANRVVLDNAGAVQIVAGSFLQCGSTGPTTNSPQIRSGDAAFRIHGSGSVVELSSTTGAVRINGQATGTSIALSLMTANTVRLNMLGNGEWSGGASGQYWKWQSGAFPVFSSLALSDLPSQAADTFLGRLAGAGTPTAQLLSDIDSTSIVYDATSHTFQRAAVTGSVELAQNANASNFGSAAAGDSMTRQSTNQALGYIGNATGNDLGAVTGAQGVVSLSGVACGGCVTTNGATGDYTIAGFDAPPNDGWWFDFVDRSTSGTVKGTFLEAAGSAATDLRLPGGVDLVFERGSCFRFTYQNSRWRVSALPSDGRLLRVTHYTSGSAATHTWLANARKAIIDVLSSGGGGASVAAPAASSATVGGGGGSGVWVRALWNISTTTLTYTVGAAASGNSAGNLSSVTDGTSTISCPGGPAGVALASGTSATYIGGGSSVAAPTLTGAGSGFTVLNGASSSMHPGDGGIGERVSGTVGRSGDGAPSPMGGGTASGRITTGTGIAAKAPGAGGGGALSLNAGGAATGGASLAGFITIYEFS